jgi:hypothetical protein
MVTIIRSLAATLVSLFWSRAKLHHEILVLRHQLNILRRTAPKRVALTNGDRLFLVWSYRLCPSVLRAVCILRPETIVRWHRHGFRTYWRWRSRARPGRPRTSRDVRDLIREISLTNPLWGAPRIHGELLKLGIDVAQSTVAKYVVKHRRPPSPSWRSFLHNHADAMALSFCAMTVAGWCPLPLPLTRRRNGSPGRLTTPSHGTLHRAISSAIAIVRMASSSGGACMQ